MNTDGTGFSTCKECHKTESLWNRTITDHKEGEQLEDRRNVRQSNCNFGDGTDQRVQSLMFMMMTMMMMMMMTKRCLYRVRRISCISFSYCDSFKRKSIHKPRDFFLYNFTLPGNTLPSIVVATIKRVVWYININSQLDATITSFTSSWSPAGSIVGVLYHKL